MIHQHFCKSLVIPLLLGVTPAWSAVPSCQLRSTSMPDAVIRLHYPGSPLGIWTGQLEVAGKRRLGFQLSMFQGYADRIWSIPGRKDRGEFAIAFSRGLPSKAQVNASRVDAFLFPGLGADLYYGGDRNNLPLLRAAEGFWRIESGCQDRFLFGS